MSLSMAEQHVSYDNPYAPIVRFLDNDDTTDDQCTIDSTFHPSLSEHLFKSISLEDLVKSFDTTINACFSDEDEEDEEINQVPNLPPSPSPSANSWADLIHHLQTSLREDLKLPQIAEQCQKSLTMINDEIPSIDMIDEDEDLPEQLDMHSIILAKDHLHAEPFLTAEQVISDIDDMLQDFTPDSGYADDFFDLTRSMEKAKIKPQSIESLQQTIDELEQSIKQLSGILVDELALRDELEFEKETKNTFISLVLTIQNKRQLYQGDKRPKRRSLLGLTASVDAGIYLTTVIPYDARYLSVEHLQCLNKILHAMNEDSPQVPDLLTNYILKVLCPS